MTLVVVTRPEGPDGPLHAALRAAGLEPLTAPTFSLDVAPEAPGPDALDGFPWVAWTSAAAVEVVRPAPSPATHHAAVGGATARALEERGITPAVVGEGGSGQLAELLAAELGPGTRLLYPRSARADRAFAERLRSFGIDVEDPVAYRVGSGDAGAVRTALARRPAAVTFASPSAVKEMVALSGTEWADDVLLATIGPTTSTAVAAELRAPDVVAAEPSFESLAAALAGTLRECVGEGP